MIEKILEPDSSHLLGQHVASWIRMTKQEPFRSRMKLWLYWNKRVKKN